MIKGRKEGEKNAWVNHALSQVGGYHKSRVLPLRVVEAEQHDQYVPNEH